MKFYSIVKICHKIITLAVIVLSITQCYKTHVQWRGFPQRQEFIPFEPFFIFVLIWLYITGILIAIKAIFSFKEEKSLTGFGFLIISLLFFLFSHYIVGYFFMFLYLMGT